MVPHVFHIHTVHSWFLKLSIQTPFIADSPCCPCKHRSQLTPQVVNIHCMHTVHSWLLKMSIQTPFIGCMDTNLIVITNTDWLIDWWFLSGQAQLFHVYSGREKVQQYIKYTLKWVRDLQPGEPFVTITGSAWWVGCGHKIIHLFIQTPFIAGSSSCPYKHRW
jgi:hypothetical protein